MMLMKRHLDMFDFSTIQQQVNHQPVQLLSRTTSRVFSRLDEVLSQLAGVELQYHAWTSPPKQRRQTLHEQYEAIVKDFMAAQNGSTQHEKITAAETTNMDVKEVVIACNLRANTVKILTKLHEKCTIDRHAIRQVVQQFAVYDNEYEVGGELPVDCGLWALSVLVEYRILKSLVVTLVAADSFAFKDACLNNFNARSFITMLDDIHSKAKEKLRTSASSLIDVSGSIERVLARRSSSYSLHGSAPVFDSIRFWKKFSQHCTDKIMILFDLVVREKQQSAVDRKFSDIIPNPIYTEMQEFVKNTKAANISILFHVESDLDFAYSPTGYSCPSKNRELPTGIQSFPVICSVPRIFILDEHLVNIVSIVQYSYDSLSDWTSLQTICFFDRKFNFTYLITMVARYSFMVMLYDGNREGEPNLLKFCGKMANTLRDNELFQSISL